MWKNESMKTLCPAPEIESAAPGGVAAGRPRVARLLLPREHGSWALAFEPLVLGLLVAPSPAGVGLSVAVAAAFFARTPCKLSLTGKTLAERRLARRLLLALTMVAAAGLGFAAGLRGFAALWPLLLALPSGVVFWVYDLRNDARAGVAEAAGAAAFACIPGALATLAGFPTPVALALTLVMLVRAVPTVLVIRACLRRRKGRPAAPRLALFTAWAGLVALIALDGAGLVGWTPAVLAGVLALRAVWLFGPFAPAWSAKRLGILEAILGAAYVIGSGMGI